VIQFDRWVKFGHFRLVVAIVQSGSILRAANSLNMSQPSATKLLQDLESVLAAPLFRRNNRGVEPTEFGLEFYGQARKILAQLEQTSMSMKCFANGEVGYVALGTLMSAASYLLPATIVRLRQSRPHIHLKIVEGTNDRLMPSLASGELDLIIGRLTEIRHRNDIDQEKLLGDSLHIVTRSGHPLAHSGPVPLSALAKADWILPPAETTLRRQLESIFHDAGVSAPKAAVESVSFLNNRLLLLQSDMISVWPRTVVESGLDSEEFTTLKTEEALPASILGISRRRGAVLSQSAQAVIEELRATASRGWPQKASALDTALSFR